MAEQTTMPANLLSDYILMPRRLTAANGAKATLSGEHSEFIELPCTSCDHDEPDEECGLCGGAGSYMQHVPISWSCIKLIYAQAVEGLARELPSLPCDVMLPPATIIRPAPTEQLWAVHAQGPDELWAAESREEAEHHAAALNALPGQTDTIKVNAVVIPSPWSEVEHWKTLAEQWRNEAEDRIASLQSTRAALENVTKVARGNLELLDENTALRGRAADLLHLLQYATITTPSSGDAEQAMIAMGDLSRMISAPSDTSAVSLEAHRDNTAVDRFASAMKSKLSEGRAAGRYGWHDPKLCSDLHIARMLIEHLPKGNAGNFEDIANLSMMLHQRGADPAVLAKAAAQKPDPAVVVRVVHRDGEVLDPEVLATSAAFDSLPHDTRVALYAIADAAIDDKEAADA